MFIDLQKAFDTIDHNILIKKAENMGLRGIVINWLMSYLNNRKQCVEFRNNKSSLRDVVCGVPQRSILGPLLSMIYINDICNASENLNFVLYADDTAFYTTDNDIDIVVNHTNIELNKMYYWLCLSKLSLNVDKSNYILYSTTKIKGNYYLNINNNNVEKVDSTKISGVFIDDRLAWKYHISDACRKISMCIAILNKVEYVLNTKSMYALYCALILPHLTYCVEVLGNDYKTNLMSLYLLQKKAIHVVCKNNLLDHTLILFSSLCTLPLSDLIWLRSAMFMCKVYYDLLPLNLLEHFLHTPSYHSTRQIKKFYVKYSRTTKKQHSITYIGPRLWNSLEIFIKDNTNLNLFRLRYKHKLMSSLL